VSPATVQSQWKGRQLTTPAVEPTGQVSHLRTLEKENGKLARKLDTYERQHANVEVLKEANKALEKKVRGMDEMRKQVAAQEAEVEALRREKSDW
jgi:mitotic spindle assembly checkpoint protein MAD1